MVTGQFATRSAVSQVVDWSVRGLVSLKWFMENLQYIIALNVIQITPFGCWAYLKYPLLDVTVIYASDCSET